MAKKLPSQTKTDHKKCMVCTYCESACGTGDTVIHEKMYMGQHADTPIKIDYYCNRSCILAHGVQDRGICLRKKIADICVNEVVCKDGYFKMLTDPKSYEFGTHTTSSLLSRSGYYKHTRLFYEGCLARKSTEELHLLRMKAKKYAGECLEHSMVVQDEARTDAFSSEMQSDLKDENNYYIAIFARD